MYKWSKVMVLVLLVLVTAMVVSHLVQAAPAVANSGAPVPPTPWLIANSGAPVPPTPWTTQNSGAPVPPTPWTR
jgi:hypothetical protein